MSGTRRILPRNSNLLIVFRLIPPQNAATSRAVMVHSRIGGSKIRVVRDSVMRRSSASTLYVLLIEIFRGPHYALSISPVLMLYRASTPRTLRSVTHFVPMVEA